MSTGNEEYKDIKRIEGADIESGLLERQLGFEKGNDGKFKMKYRPEGEVAGNSISFTPDGGDPTFSTVEITTVMDDQSDDKQATPKKYVDDKIKDIASTEPDFNGFVKPDKITVSFDPSTLIATITTSEEQNYYVKNKRYSFVGSLYCQMDAGFNGKGFLFLKEDGNYAYSTTWLDGYLPILSFNRNTSVGSSPQEKFLTLTKDYHGTAMKGATKHYVNMHTGAWLEWGCEVYFESGKLRRTEGGLMNDDVYHSMNAASEVIPSIGYMTGVEWGKEIYATTSPDANWTTNRDTWYQSIDESTGVGVYGPGEAGKGGWYLYFVRPDTRNNEWNDVVLPLDKSVTFEKRFYPELNDSIRVITDHFIDYVVDWKVMGLVFVQGGAIKDYVNIASFGVNDLLRGNLSISNLGAVSSDAVIISDLQYSTSERLAIIDGSSAGNSEASEIIGVGIGNNQVVVKGVADLLVHNRTGKDTILRAGTFVYRDTSDYSYGQIVSEYPGGVQINDIAMPFVGVLAETTNVPVANDAIVTVKVLVDIEKTMADSQGWTEIYNGPQKKFTYNGNGAPVILAETENVWGTVPMTSGGILKVECDLGTGGYGEAVFSFDSVGYDSNENVLIKLYDTTSISMGGSMISSIEMVHVGESPVGQKQYLIMTFNSPGQNANNIKISVLSSYNIQASTEDLHSLTYRSYQLHDQKIVLDGKQEEIALGTANQILTTNSTASDFQWVDATPSGGVLRGVGFDNPSAVQLNWSERESGPYSSKIGTLSLTFTEDVIVQNSNSTFQIASGTNKSIEIGVTDFDQINGGECTLYVFMNMDGTLKLSLTWEKDLPSIAVIVADINADIANGMNGFIGSFVEVIHDIHGTDMSLSTREYMNVRGAHIHELLYTWTEKGDWNLYNRIACDGGVLVNDDINHTIPSHANTTEGYVKASITYLEKSAVTNYKVAYRNFLPSESFITNIFSPADTGIYAQVDNSGNIGKEYKNRALYVHVIKPDVRGDGFNHSLVMTDVVPTGSQYTTREQSEVFARECKSAINWVLENYSSLVFDWKIMGIVDVYKSSNTEAAIGYTQLKDTDLVSLEFGDWERRVLNDVQSDDGAAEQVIIKAPNATSSSLNRLCDVKGSSIGQSDSERYVGICEKEGEVVIAGTATLLVHNNTGNPGQFLKGCPVFMNYSSLFAAGQLKSLNPDYTPGMEQLGLAGYLAEDTPYLNDQQGILVKVLISPRPLQTSSANAWTTLYDGPGIINASNTSSDGKYMVLMKNTEQGSLPSTSMGGIFRLSAERAIDQGKRSEAIFSISHPSSGSGMKLLSYVKSIETGESAQPFHSIHLFNINENDIYFAMRTTSSMTDFTNIKLEALSTSNISIYTANTNFFGSSFTSLMLGAVPDDGSGSSDSGVILDKVYTAAVAGTTTLPVNVAGYSSIEIEVSLKGTNNNGNVMLQIDGESGLRYEQSWHTHHWNQWGNHTTPHGYRWCNSFSVCGKPDTTEGYDSAIATAKLQIKSGSDAGTYAPPIFSSEIRAYKDHLDGSEKFMRSVMGRFETAQVGYPEIQSLSLLVSDIAAGSKIRVKGIK